MGFHVFGINHQTASIALREQLAVLPEAVEAMLVRMRDALTLGDTVILSTCNRTEIYLWTDDVEPVITWFCQDKALEYQQLIAHSYHFEHMDAVRHALRVSSGLNSMVLGEPQILGQMKYAVTLAKKADMVGAKLARQFDFVFFGAKKIRTQSALGEHVVSLGSAVLRLVQQVFSHPDSLSALFVGAGEMNELIITHLLRAQFSRYIISSRTLARAQTLCENLKQAHPQFVFEPITLAQLPDYLASADVICSCTGSALPVISKMDMTRALKARRHRPILAIDLAVPRDIEPSVHRLDDVFLYAIDDLQTVIESNSLQRQEASIHAEQLVDELTSLWQSQQRELDIAPLIARYRMHAQQQGQQVLVKLLQKQAVDEQTVQLMEQLTQLLTAKLSHIPTQLLKKLAADYPSALDELNALLGEDE